MLLIGAASQPVAQFDRSAPGLRRLCVILDPAVGAVLGR